MKIMVVLLFLLLVSNCASNRIKTERPVELRDLPQAVQLGFSKIEGTEKRFFIEKENGILTYEIDYTQKNKQYSEEYNEKFEIIEIETRIRFEDLPPDIQKKISSKVSSMFKEWTIYQAEEISIGRIKKLEVEVTTPEVSTGLCEFTFDELGNFLAFEKEEMEPIITPN